MRVEEIIDVEWRLNTSIIELLSSASNSVYISSDLIMGYGALDEIQKAIEKVASKVSDFRFLLDADTRWDQIEQHSPWFAKLIKDKRIPARKSSKPIQPWLIVDGKSFRLEKEYPEESIGKSNLLIWGAQKPLADMLLNKWNSWWDDGTDLR